MPRKWIKKWIEPSLHGTTSTELTPLQEHTWDRLLLLAGKSPVDGVVCVAAGKPWGDVALANECRCTVEELRVTRELCVKFGKIEDNHTGIKILNWLEYQGPLPDSRTEYWRDYKRRKRTSTVDTVESSQAVHNKTIDYRLERGGEVEVGRTTKIKVGGNKASGKVTLSPAQRTLFDILKRLPSIKEADGYKLVEILEDFPDSKKYKGELDYALIFKHFVEWWSTKKSTRPWAALRNWMAKEVEDGVRKGRLQKKRVYHAPAGGEDDDE